MKKTVFSVMLVAIVAFCSLSAQAQLSKGEKQVNIGVGLIGLGLNATAEYGIIDDLGVGAYFGYERDVLRSWTGYSGSSSGSILIGPRGTYHFNRLLNINSDKFDVYASGGLLLRYYMYDKEYRDAYRLFYDRSPNSTNIDFLARVGANYNLSEKMRLFGDFGSGGSLIQAGISFKF